MAEFTSVLRRNQLAAKVIDQLTESPCEADAILRELYFYCVETPGVLEKKYFYARDGLLALSKQLKEDAHEIEKAADTVVQMGLTIYVQRFENLPRTLTDYADLLDVLYQSAKKGDFRQGGRKSHLVYLVFLIENLRNKKHYQEIAELIGAYREVYHVKSDATPTAESIRKVVENYKKRHVTYLLATAAEDEAEILRNSWPLDAPQTATSKSPS